MKFWYFRRTLFFSQGNEITLRGKKCTALFQTHNQEKSSFFNALLRVFAQICANTWQGGHNVPPPLGQIGLTLYTPGREGVYLCVYLNIYANTHTGALKKLDISQLWVWKRAVCFLPQEMISFCRNRIKFVRNAKIFEYGQIGLKGDSATVVWTNKQTPNSLANFKRRNIPTFYI